MKKLRLSPGLVIVAVLWLALTLWCWLKPPGDISQSERRKLAQFPEVSARSVLSGRFADINFPNADKLRKLGKITL